MNSSASRYASGPIVESHAFSSVLNNSTTRAHYDGMQGNSSQNRFGHQTSNINKMTKLLVHRNRVSYDDGDAPMRRQAVSTIPMLPMNKLCSHICLIIYYIDNDLISKGTLNSVPIIKINHK